MAYNNGYPMYSPQYSGMPLPSQGMGQQYAQQGYQQGFQGQQLQQSIQQPQQIQNGGFMLVPSEDIARSYPVAPGNCVTFKIEGQPIVMEKSMGFSQLEAPRVERYRLVREDESAAGEKSPAEAPEASQQCVADIEELRGEIANIWKNIDKLKEQIRRPIKRKDEEAS